jgi:hypothetical protein
MVGLTYSKEYVAASLDIEADHITHQFGHSASPPPVPPMASATVLSQSTIPAVPLSCLVSAPISAPVSAPIAPVPGVVHDLPSMISIPGSVFPGFPSNLSVEYSFVACPTNSPSFQASIGTHISALVAVAVADTTDQKEEKVMFPTLDLADFLSYSD